MPSLASIPTPKEVFMQRFLAKVQKTETCWIWTGAKQNPRRSQPDPYGVMLVCWRPRYAMLAHRLSWELFHGELADDICVLHKCDNPPCVNPEHLFLGTQKQNMEDCASKMRQRHGEGHLQARLTDIKVLEIRSKYGPGCGYVALGLEYGVGKSTIEAIITRHTWRHL